MKAGCATKSSRRGLRTRILIVCALVVGVMTGVLVAQAAQAATTVLDVTQFGAKGDGATDNTAIIQSVIDRAGANPVYLPAGTYVVTGTLNLRSGLTMYGAGAGTVIKLVGGDDWTRVIVGTGVSNVTLHDFTVDGNAASATITGSGEQRHCIFLSECSNSLLQRITATQPLGDGIFLYGSSTGITVRDCVCIAGDTGNPRVGINFQGASNCVVTGCTVLNFDVGYKAELDEGEPDSVGMQILGNTASGTNNPLALNGKTSGKCKNYLIQGNSFTATGDYNIWVSGSAGCMIQNNTLSGGIGVYSCFDNQSLTVQGNTMKGNADCDIYLGEIYNLGASDGIHVTGNMFPVGSHAQGNIFHVGTTVTGVEIDSNHYSTAGTFYNPALGATAYVHDNVADGGSTTSTTVASTTTTTAAPTTTTSSTTTTIASTTTTAAPATTASTVMVYAQTPEAPSTPTTVAAVTSPPAPSVVFATPVDGATVSGRVSIAVSVSSSVKLSQVLLFCDGKRQGQDSHAPYSFNWNTATVASGAHSLTAVAYDRHGNEVARATCSVLVKSTISSSYHGQRLLR